MAAGRLDSAQDRASVQALRQVQAGERRLATVGHRIALANAALCAPGEWRLGLALHAASQYAAGFRTILAQEFGFHRGVAVLALAEGGPAERAGLRPGDLLLAADGILLATPGEPGRGGSYYEAAAAMGRIEAAAADGIVTFTVGRGTAQVRVPVAGARGCASRFQLAVTHRLVAAADGQTVQLSTGVLGFVRSDDELASVLAHELAHNILRHRRRLDAMGIQRGFLQQFGRSARLTRESELEADRLGIRLMARAGYDPQAALAYVARAMTRPDYGEGGTHPRGRDRLAAMREEIARLPSRLNSSD